MPLIGFLIIAAAAVIALVGYEGVANLSLMTFSVILAVFGASVLAWGGAQTERQKLTSDIKASIDEALLLIGVSRDRIPEIEEYEASVKNQIQVGAVQIDTGPVIEKRFRFMSQSFTTRDEAEKERTAFLKRFGL